MRRPCGADTGRCRYTEQSSRRLQACSMTVTGSQLSRELDNGSFAASSSCKETRIQQRSQHEAFRVELNNMSLSLRTCVSLVSFRERNSCLCALKCMQAHAMKPSRGQLLWWLCSHGAKAYQHTALYL